MKEQLDPKEEVEIGMGESEETKAFVKKQKEEFDKPANRLKRSLSRTLDRVLGGVESAARSEKLKGQREGAAAAYDRLKNREYYSQADALIGEHKLDNCGIDQGEFRMLLVKMLTPGNADEIAAAIEIKEKYSEETLGKIADVFEKLASDLDHQQIASGVVSLQKILGTDTGLGKMREIATRERPEEKKKK